MERLDIRTVYVSGMVNFIICMLVVATLWYQSRDRFRGLGFLLADYVAQALAVMLIALRSHIPDVVSIGVSNSLVFLGSILGLMGLERFVGKVRSQVVNFALLAVYAAAYFHYSLVPTSLAIRNITFSVGLTAIWAQCAWLLLVRADRGIRRITQGMGFVFVGLCITNLLRLGHTTVESGSVVDYMKSGSFEVSVMLAYGALVLLMTVTLVLMVSRRLSEELRGQEAKFSTAFRSCPYAMLLTRLEDGRIFEVNDRFLELGGFSPADLLGRTTPELRVWFCDEDRLSIVRELEEAGRVRDRELQFRRKSGELITGLFSADIITINGEKCVLASCSNITERKRMEEEIRQLSLRDTLTGLLNRRGFLVTVEQIMKEALREQRHLSLVFLDTDGLKEINDVHGHDEGDRALVDTANVLSVTFRESDVIARLGGDEFAVCVMEAADPDFGRDRFLGRLEANIAAFRDRETRPYWLAMSWGVAVYDPASPRSLDELLAEADAAMYQQKRLKQGNG